MRTYLTKRREPHPIVSWILIILLFFLGIGGMISGALLFAAPDGHLVGFTPALLQGSPFPDFLIPGIILFLFVGAFQLFTAIGMLTRTDWTGPDIINPFKIFHWAWTASWAAGVIMLIWIGVETALLGYISTLQPIIAVWGIVLIGLTLLPSIRKYYRKGPPSSR
jgi:hypothetical protein